MDNLMELRLLEYDTEIDNYRKLEPIVISILEDKLREAGIRPMQIAHRVKTRESVAGQMERKPDKYTSLRKMTDLLGIRIICYFNDQVDQIAELIRQSLVIDLKNSVDKRELLEPTAFGYLSLHFICSLPEDSGYPNELCDLKFEIQIRTVLQHTWAEIEHDLGYKTEFGIPRKVRREFSRVAGLLEIADESFLRIRSFIRDYEIDVRNKITNDEAAEMPLDLVSLRAYLELSKTMQRIQQPKGSIPRTKVIIDTPKSLCSSREIPITEELLPLLTQFRQPDACFLLTGDADSFMEPRCLENHFNAMIRNCSIEGVTMHTCRHSFATRCVELGFDVKTLSEILGHASVSITMNRYMHPSMDLKRENMSKLSSLFRT